MCYYIGIECVASNALINALKAEEGDLSQCVITYSELEAYGQKVVRKLNETSKAILIFSRESTNMMFRDYSDFFEEKETPEGLGISLKKGKTVSDLIEHFRKYLALDVMLAFISEDRVANVKVVNG